MQNTRGRAVGEVLRELGLDGTTKGNELSRGSLAYLLRGTQHLMAHGKDNYNNEDDAWIDYHQIAKAFMAECGHSVFCPEGSHSASQCTLTAVDTETIAPLVASMMERQMVYHRENTQKRERARASRQSRPQAAASSARRSGGQRQRQRRESSTVIQDVVAVQESSKSSNSLRQPGTYQSRAAEGPWPFRLAQDHTVTITGRQAAGILQYIYHELDNLRAQIYVKFESASTGDQAAACIGHAWELVDEMMVDIKNEAAKFLQY